MEHKRNNEFTVCENELRDEFDKERNKRFAKILGADSFNMKNMSNVMKYYRVEIDGNIVNKIYIDEYNNLHCEIPFALPVHYLSLFRRFFNEYLEREDSFKHRSGSGFFIRYFKTFYSCLSISQVQAMCNIDDMECENLEHGCFRTWLITDSYCCCEGGNLKNNYNFEKLGWDTDLFERKKR